MKVRRPSFKNSIDTYNKIGLWLIIFTLNFGDSIMLLGMSLSRIVTIVVMIGVVLGIIRDFGSDRIHRRKYAYYFLVFWLVHAIIQRIWVADGTIWMSQFFSTCINILIGLAVLSVTNDRYSLRFILSAVHISLLLQIAIGFIEIKTHRQFVEMTTKVETTWIHSFFGNPNDYASWIYMCFVCTIIYISLKEKRWWTNIYIVFLTAASFLIQWHTESRSGIGCMLIFLILYLVMRVWLMLTKKDRRMMLIGKMAVVICCCVGLFIVISLLVSNDLVGWTLSRSGVMYNSDLSRINLMRKSISVFLDYFCLGAGAGQSAYIIGFPLHNFFLEILSDFGIVVFCMMLKLLLDSWNMTFNRMNTDHERSMLLAFFPSFILMSIGSSSLVRLRMVWVMIICIYIWSNRLYKDNMVSENENTNDVRLLSVRYGVERRRFYT